MDWRIVRSGTLNLTHYTFTSHDAACRVTVVSRPASGMWL